MTSEAWRKSTYGEAMRETEERAQSAVDLPVLSVTKTRGPMLASERFGKAMHGRDLGRYRVARRNTVVVDPMLLWDGSIGLQTVVDAGLVSPDYRVYEPAPNVVPQFLGYLVRSPAMLPHYQGGARGTNVRRNRIARSDFLAIPIGLPPNGEQRKIAAVLASVDETIEATQAVIEQLQLVKNAIMAELLTRGLPGRHTRFKHTEIGEVPEGWEVARGEDLFRLAGGYGPSDLQFSPKANALFLKVDDFNRAANDVGLVDAALRFAPEENPGIRTYGPGALIFPKRGAAIFKNRVQVLRATATVDPNLMVLEVGPRLNADFFAYQMLAIGLHTLSDNSGIPQLNNKHLYPHFFVVPSSDEQNAIGETLKAIDNSIRAESRCAEQLGDLKSALMSVLLTGEVRVNSDPESA